MRVTPFSTSFYYGRNIHPKVENISRQRNAIYEEPGEALALRS